MNWSMRANMDNTSTSKLDGVVLNGYIEQKCDVNQVVVVHVVLGVESPRAEEANQSALGCKVRQLFMYCVHLDGKVEIPLCGDCHAI